MIKPMIAGITLATLFAATPTFAATNSQHQFNVDAGYTTLDYGHSSDQVFTTTVGYSYYFSPFMGVDLGYNGTMSSTAKLRDGNGNAIETKYDSFYGGIRAEAPVTRYATLYARGGFAYTQLEETNVSTVPETSSTHSGVNPYVSAGARVATGLNPNLEFTAEVSYQDLDKGYSSTSFSVGARFRM
ncbi:outer membrane beta-barrel protein [Vibrio fluvialis]|uniref:outer membrane beta-barrel protein n=1 Tax=Vibrio fluvialis TaxID=676 RepID=UPI001F19639F|nr:outer membrane beta-barrel protein [Vibrio fluvialis]MCE7595266.1 porin family protein [Vibrio fluvialis]